MILKTSDDGAGLSSGWDVRQTEPLGHQSAFIRAEKLRGTVDVMQDHGTVFRVAFQAKCEEERI